MILKQPDNLSKLLAAIAILGINCTPAYAATLATSHPSPQPAKQLLAQQVTCTVTNLRSGQLALRYTPGGKVKAGLDNGNTVQFLSQGDAPGVYVRVLNGPNSDVNGLEGWVNSNYLVCNDASESHQVYCDVTNLRSGQLALRYTPGGKVKAGLDNGNTVQFLSRGDSPWVYVRVLDGPNASVNGLEGWVNSNYLSCHD